MRSRSSRSAGVCAISGATPNRRATATIEIVHFVIVFVIVVLPFDIDAVFMSRRSHLELNGRELLEDRILILGR